MTEILSQDFLNNIKDKLQKVKSTNEAEISILQITSLTIFNNMLKSFKKRAMLNNLTIKSENSLDVLYNYDNNGLSSYRISVNELENINNIISNIYERENHVVFALLSSYILQKKENILIIEKIKNTDNMFVDTPNNLKFRLSDEKKVDIEQVKKLQYLNNKERNKIIFRFKNRLSLLIFEDENIKISTDLTFVKTTNKAVYINRGKETYELEVEMLFKKDIKNLDKKYITMFINEVIYLMKIIQNTEEIISIDETENVLTKLKQLTKSADNIKGLPAVQTVSAEVIHITDTIPNDYSVTDKADGERHFLMIFNKNVYLISNNLVVKKIKEYNKKEIGNYEDTILDGEYIFIKKYQKFMFLGFDILFHQGKDIREEMLLTKRYELLNDVTMKLFDQTKSINKYNGDFDVKKIEKYYQKDIKEYVSIMNEILNKSNKKNIILSKYFIFPIGGHPVEIYLYSKLIWDEYANAPYLLDGLIYTPIKQKYNIISSTTVKSTFKWKPSSKNSIDFYVLYEKDQDTKQILNVYDNSIEEQDELNIDDKGEIQKEKNKIYRILNLYVGKNENGKETPVLFQKEEKNYIANIYLTNNEVRDIEGNIIEDKTVVEFAYDKNLPEHFRWIPLRTRMDKTDIVLKYQKKYGNAEWVSNKTWKSMMDSIEISDIELLSKLDTYEKHSTYLKSKITAKSIEQMRQENKYYQEKNELAKQMRQFHNFIKSNIIYTYCSLSYNKKKMDILDIGCGVGGDINKFYHARVGSYIGIDIDYGNLFSAGDSATSRYNNFKKKFPNFTDMKFIQASASVQFDLNNQNATIGNMKDENKKLIMNTFGEDENSKNYKTFDIMNAQFTIHYYFENDNSLNNFLNNVKKYLRQHGFLLVTTFDANIVHNTFNKDGKINAEYMSSDGNNSILYDINRLYPSNTKNLKQTGLAIDVLMKWINQEDYYKEYLVEPSFLIESMDKIGLSLIETDTFKNLFDNYKDYLNNYVKNESIDNTKKFLMTTAKYYDENFKNFHSYSFLFRYYIFQKN
jgi:SAM-dependent methyltransferase